MAPYPPAGQTDVVSRYFADKLTGVLGQQVIVENKPGAQGMVGAEMVKHAAPDGHTFLYVNSSMMCINPYVYKKLPYDGFKDFVPVTQHGLAPLAMVTPPWRLHHRMKPSSTSESQSLSAPSQTSLRIAPSMIWENASARLVSSVA